MKAIFDLDDTICIHKNRDYANAKPIEPVIAKMREMEAEGWDIAIYTSRGQVSCKGDINKIEKEKRATAEKWLQENNVPYKELIFGKPLGDLYVDDKAMSLTDFQNATIEKLSGGSGYLVYRIGNIVKKTMSDENHKRYKEWIEDSKGIVKTPSIISEIYSTIYMPYYQPEEMKPWHFATVLNDIKKMSTRKRKKFDLQYHIKKLEKHKDGTIDEQIDYCKELLNKIDLEKHASLSHSDLTLSNIIVSKGECIYIDPQYERTASTYLNDYAKILMSLDGYEELFCNKKYPHLEIFKEMIETAIEPVKLEVGILEYMWSIRLNNYQKDKTKVKKFVEKIRGKVEKTL